VLETPASRNFATTGPDAVGVNPGGSPAPPVTAKANGQTLRVLQLEDNPTDAELVLRALKKDGLVVSSDVTQSAEGFMRQVRTHGYDVILADYNLPQWSGLEALDLMRKEGLDIPLILVTGSLGDVTAVDCIKRGATDYILKDRLAGLSVSVQRALDEKRLREQHKQSQQELARKVEELARSNRELEQFAYVASHDLQEPLRMIAAYTQLLAERYRGKLDEKADKYIHYAVDGAQRMQALIQDLLAFSRVGRQGLALKSTDCNTVLENATKNLQAAIEESGATITHDPLPVLIADATQLQQLFQNLIGNGIKFRGSHKPVIEICVEPKGQEWIFSVRDNGIGIAPENAETVFVIFQRLHTRAEYPGNGIGLSICKKIVEQHGGKIWVDPNPGPGTTFKFTLPLAAPEAVAAARAGA
jgi:signal transduction histidine kinase